MPPDEDSMTLELLSYGGILYVDARKLPVAVTVGTPNGPRNFHGGSTSQALAQACRSLAAGQKKEEET